MDNSEVLADLLELEYRQQQLLEFTQRVIHNAIEAGWRVEQTAEDRYIPRLHLVPPIPDRLPDDVA